VEALSRQVGGGWGGVPVLALGVLAAPNAVIAAASYLAGPGFAVGSGASVNAITTSHGVVPAFPILGALPHGHGATPVVWTVVIATPLVAGMCVARIAARTDGWRNRFRDAALAALIAALVMFVLSWQGGGGIGTGRLHVVGASPWRVALFVGGQIAVTSALALAVSGGWTWWRRRSDGEDGTVLGWLARNDFDAKPLPTTVADATTTADQDRAGKLAG
jgi:hypothetical protein